MLGAIAAAVASSLCFGLAAALQHREALRVGTSGVADVRLLWRLCRRPWWLVGVVADVASICLHVLALSMATLALVQPLGVLGIVFAIPLAALVGGHRVSRVDLSAAAVVVVGLWILLTSFPAPGVAHVPSVGAVLAVTGVVGLGAGVATAGAGVFSGRVRALLLAAGAGTAFGGTAVLVRTLLLLIDGRSAVAILLWTGAGIAVLALGGYLLLQHAYRAGHFAGAVATATVVDPVVAVLTAGVLLHESLPHDPGSLVVTGVALLMVCAGVALLVRSPAATALAPLESTGGAETTDQADALVQ